MKIKTSSEASLGALIRRSEFYTAGFIILVIVAFVIAASATNPGEVIAALGHVGVKTALIVVMLALGNYLLRLLRFRYLLGRKGHQVSLGSLARIYVAGFAMTATPGKLGEFIRIWLLKRAYALRYSDTLPASIADRASDVIATALLAALTAASFMAYALPIAVITAIIALATILLMRADLLLRIVNAAYAMIRRKPRIFAHLRQMVEGTASLFQPAPLLISIGLGIASWLLEGIAFYACASIFGDITLAQAVFIFTFANLVGAITFLPGGVGGTEVSMVTFLTALGFGFEEAAAITAVIRMGTLWFGICCGYVALFSWLRSQKKLASQPAAN
jgi:uncharacterized protein (TIRG00374 family)